MPDAAIIVFNFASLVCALVVLERGADIFIDHTVIVGHRTGIPQSAIALLTAGAEWEELVVVVISVARKRPSLAIGNVIGSSISNILGAFSIGLVCHRNLDDHSALFDGSSRAYSVLLLLVTAGVAVVLAFGNRVKLQPIGGCFIGLFALYIISISYLIAKGLANSPREIGSDSDSDGTEDPDLDDNHYEQEQNRSGKLAAPRSLIDSPSRDGSFVRQGESSAIMPSSRTHVIESMLDHPPVHASSVDTPVQGVLETLNQRSGRNLDDDDDDCMTFSGQEESHQPILPETSLPERLTPTKRIHSRSVAYHTAMLGAGFFSIVISGYVISNAASNLVDELGLSDILGGIVLLSIATTIPEKFVAALSGYRGHMSIMLANTVGSNVFLLTLCMGIVWVTSGASHVESGIVPSEIGVMLGSTVTLTVAVFLQGRFARIFGVGMLLSYVAFIALEVAVIHKA